MAIEKVVQPEGNYFNKYEEANLIVRKIMDGYFRALDECVSMLKIGRLLEAGCGEAYVSNYLFEKLKCEVHGFDVSESVIKAAQGNFPSLKLWSGSIYETKLEDNSYDVVVCVEVLEHLEEPDNALAEISRITRKYLILSVPNEPIWRISNFFRGKYLTEFGNTPGHINHWGSGGFLNLCKKYGKVAKYLKPFPWQMVLLEVK